MKIKTLKIRNFRGYKDEITINFCNLTSFVGKNDIGKSTILEALDIFFNDGNGVIKIDKDDINKRAVSEGETEIYISVCFEDLPNTIVIDATNETTLQSEYLLNMNGQLEIIKRYSNANKAKIFIKANHPTNPSCCDLLLKKNADLKRIIEQQNIQCDDRNKNSVMRKAIWNNYNDNLQLAEIEIDITKGDDVKSIWDKLSSFLPLYTLFQSDRKNSDNDSEVQDPLKEAAKQILSEPELNRKLLEIASEVKNKLQEVSNSTLNKLREINPNIASSLNPIIPSAESLKWQDVFKNLSISSDGDIPINKRGSGIKRLVLLSFFRAEAERRKTSSQSIIYAIEEPETSQHTEHQKILIKALLSLADNPNTQITITTHSAMIVKELDFENLRLISEKNGVKTVSAVMPNQLPYPSLNEVNFLAFSEISEEYHNELFGFIEAEGKLADYKIRKTNNELRKNPTKW